VHPSEELFVDVNLSFLEAYLLPRLRKGYPLRSFEPFSESYVKAVNAAEIVFFLPYPARESRYVSFVVLPLSPPPLVLFSQKFPFCFTSQAKQAPLKHHFPPSKLRFFRKHFYPFPCPPPSMNLKPLPLFSCLHISLKGFSPALRVFL